MNKYQHGGKRPGSGRKTVSPQEQTVQLTVRVSRSQWEWINRQGGNVSKFIRNLIDQAIESQKD